jgi:HEAT repeat protein
MTRADFDTRFTICMQQTGSAYRDARDAIRQAGSEVTPWLAEKRASSDGLIAATAAMLQLWRADKNLADEMLSVARGEGIGGDDKIPMGESLSVGRLGSRLTGFGDAGVPRLIELALKGEPGNEDAIGPALHALMRMRPPLALPYLVDSASRDTGGVEPSSVLAALGEIHHEGARDAALAALTNTSAKPALRSVAAAVSGQLGDVRAAPALLAMAADPTANTRLRLSAVTGLGQLGDAAGSGAVVALASLARGRDEGLALAAIAALQGIASGRSALDELARTAVIASVQSAARDASSSIA